MQENKITLKSIFKLVLDKRPALIYGQVLTLFAILVSVPIPLILPMMVDEVLLDKPANFIATINAVLGEGSAFYYVAIVTLAVISLRVTYYLLNAVIIKIFTKISKYVTFMIRKQLVEHLQITSMNEYETLGSGAITANLITDVNTFDAFIITTSSKLVSATLTLVAVAAVMIFMNPILGLMILIIQPLNVLISKKMSRAVGALKKDENEAIASFQENIGETLELYGQIKASNKEQYFFSQAITKAKKVQSTSNAYSFKSVIYEKLSNTISLSMFEVLRASGFLLVAYSDLSIGMMFAMFGYIWFIMTPIQEILSMQYSYAAAMGALERINKVLALKIEKTGTEVLNSNTVNIKLKDLNFAYSNKKPILKNINMDIQQGCKIALIGASGSGKTTLAQILSGFYEKDSGELQYNDIEVEALDKTSLREKIFLVLQMPILFNASLRFNITMGDENITDANINKALKIAQLDETISQMQDGLDTIVGHHGIRLSGGQRQRLSIARMVIANPSIVIFDESTSALDVLTEAKLYTALVPILKDKTVITIAHRLSTVKNADIIYVLESGSIIQSGSHEELEVQEGHYNEFVKNQLL
ncbi:MAG: ABC transporter ATP-binding protein [Sulfurimonas sp.]|nr:ABC transporter ATP-binding protein [Sulfurimonas sp.]